MGLRDSSVAMMLPILNSSMRSTAFLIGCRAHRQWDCVGSARPMVCPGSIPMSRLRAACAFTFGSPGPTGCSPRMAKKSLNTLDWENKVLNTSLGITRQNNRFQPGDGCGSHAPQQGCHGTPPGLIKRRSGLPIGRNRPLPPRLVPFYHVEFVNDPCHPE